MVEMVRSILWVAAALLSAAAAYEVQSARTFTVQKIQQSTVVSVIDPTSTSAPVRYVLTPRGQSAISDDSVRSAYATGAIVRFFTPLNRIAVLSTTMLPWIDLLGVSSKVKALMTASTVYSACVRSGYEVDLASADGWSMNATALAQSQVEAVFCDASWGCPGTALDIPLRDYQETSVFAVSEYIGLLSLFLGGDATSSARATSVVQSNRARYTCSAKAVTDALPLRATATKPKLLWAYQYFGYWYVASSSGWQSGLVSDAGAELITSTVNKPYAAPHWGGLTLEEFKPLLAAADVWVYANNNFETEVRPSLPSTTTAAASPELRAALQASKAVVNKKVFDLLGRHINSWFEERPANPDALLQDLIAVAHPDTYTLLLAQGSAGPRVWLRDIHTEPAVTTLAPVTAAQQQSCAFSAVQGPADLSIRARLSYTCPAYVLGADGKPVPPAAPAATGPSVLVAAAVGGTLGAIAVLAAAAFGVKAWMAQQAALTASTSGAQPPIKSVPGLEEEADLEAVVVNPVAATSSA